MKRRSVLAAVLAALTAIPPAARALTPAECSAALVGLAALVPAGVQIEGKAAPEGPGCSVRPLAIDLPEAARIGLRAEALTFGPETVAFLAGAGDRLDLVLTGLRFRAPLGEKGSEWLLMAQRAAGQGAEAQLSFTWDRLSRRLRPFQMRLAFPGVVSLTVAAEIGNVDLGTPEAAQASATGFAVTRLDLTYATEGTLDSGLLLHLARQAMQDSGAPFVLQPFIAAVKDMALALPLEAVPAPAQAALMDYLTALPRPEGVLTLTATAYGGIGPARLKLLPAEGMPVTEAALAPVLQGVDMRIGWVPGNPF